jgi:RNA polymerase sigma-70 factor (ECF subfamily)
MYPTNALGCAPPFGDIISSGGVSSGGRAVLGNAGLGNSVLATLRQERGAGTQGGPVGTEAGAETGPYAVVTGADARKVLAEQLFAANYPKLAGWVRRLVDDDDTAHEIASEAFVRLLSKWTSIDKLDSPQSYLYMIATNLVRDHWRKLERERRAMRSVSAGSEAEPYADPAQDVDVRELIAALPARLRDPFLLHYYAGFGVREIAVLLKRPDGTIKADLYHARERLKASLAERDTRRGTAPAGPAGPVRAGEGEGRGRGRDRRRNDAG